MGKFASHWSGDNISSFYHMKLSIQSIFRSGLYGIPMVGADICGFM
jgi:alpha-glucosidase (family GH31 glycosyl hydrolase)